MSVVDLKVDQATWRFADDMPPPHLASRSQALLRLQLVDEVLARPPEGGLFAVSQTAGALAKVGFGGRSGLAGRPMLLFDPASLPAARLRMQITGTGFLPLSIDEPLGVQPGYPDAFAPVELGQIALHRQPTRFVGRVASRAAGSLQNAKVTVSGVWRVQQRPVPAMQAANVMPALAGVYADRPLGAQLRRHNFTLAAAAKTLVLSVAAGSDRVCVSDSVGLVANQILAIEPGDADRVEYVGIAVIDPVTSDDQAAWLTLDLPLRRSHGEATTVTRAVPSSVGGNVALSLAARVGDQSIWPASLAGFGPATNAVALSGGGQPTEYHASRIYEATSNSFGEFALPSIHRCASVQLTVTHATQVNPIVRSVQLGWNAERQREDFLFP